MPSRGAGEPVDSVLRLRTTQSTSGAAAVATNASKREIRSQRNSDVFPDLGRIATSARACEAPHPTFFSRSNSLGHREELPLAVHIIEDEIDEVGAAASIVLDLSHQNRLAHSVAHRLGGGDGDFFRMRQQFAVRAGARAGVQPDGTVDTG